MEELEQLEELHEGDRELSRLTKTCIKSTSKQNKKVNSAISVVIALQPRVVSNN